MNWENVQQAISALLGLGPGSYNLGSRPRAIHYGTAMKLNPIEDHLRSNPGTVDDALRTLRELTESIKREPEAWENETLDRYLDAMLAWLEAMKDRVGDKPSWELFVLMLEAGKIYE